MKVNITNTIINSKVLKNKITVFPLFISLILLPGYIFAGGPGETNPSPTETTVIDPCTDIAGVDTDGDGINDICDLDDDNDGILDVSENVCTSNNLALTGTASQSSTLSGYPPSNLNDNNPSTMAHTDQNGTHEWMNIDLGSIQSIGLIKIANRQDCCQDRLSNVYVMVSSSPFPTSNTDVAGSLSNAEFTYQLGASGGISSFTIPANIDGRYIQIQKSGDNGSSNYLNVMQIEVFGFGICDTDNDGTPNYLDLDSDNDGCSDAFEAGATTDESENYQFNDVAGDADGLSPTVDPAGDGTPDYTATLEQVTDGIASCPCPQVGADTDGDGINDTCDLDSEDNGYGCPH